MNQKELFFARVQADLAPFRDPGTELHVEVRGAQLVVVWTQRRKQRTATFILDVDRQDVEAEGRLLSYRGFFASEDMADLAGIAKSSLGLHGIPEYVETDARVTPSGDQPFEGGAIDVIRRYSSGSSLDRSATAFVMVTAEAGAGKTRTLKEMVSRQARDYLAGKASYVYLYVDAQGRALAKFHEALSTELNDLRVAVPYHAIAPLVRLGLVVPVIDGFDELIGVGGYDDAFSSIASFVDDLDGSGSIVASARSTYYEQEFLSRASRRSQSGRQSWGLTTVEVKGWGDRQREQYLTLLVGADDEERARIKISLGKAFSGSNAQLADKPLFFVRVARLFAESAETALESDSLLEALVDVFLERECRDKLLDRNGNPILSVGQLSELVSDLAEEMWSQSTRELEKQTVRDLAEMAASTPGVAEASAAIVVERMPSMAFLKRGESNGSVTFEHELFFDYFLARRLVARIIEAGPHSAVALGRSAMPQSLAEQVAEEYLETDGSAEAFAEALVQSANAPSMRRAQVSENAGRLLGALLLRVKGLSNVELRELTFPGAVLSDVNFEGVSFVGCTLRRVAIASTQFVRCVFASTHFESALVSDKTRFEACAGIDQGSFTSGLRMSGDGGEVRSLFKPNEIREGLVQVGVVESSSELNLRPIDTGLLTFMDRLLRACARCNPVCLEDDQFNSIGKSEYWRDVRRLALDSGIFRREEGVQAHGPKREFLRRTVSVDDLWLGLVPGTPVPEAVTRFWSSAEAEFPAGA